MVVAKLKRKQPEPETGFINVVTGGGVRRIQYSRRVQYTQPNPKLAGSASGKRYARYMRATTVGEALKLGACLGDVRYDLLRKHLSFTTKSLASNTALPGTRLPPKGMVLNFTNAVMLSFAGADCLVPLSQKIEYRAPNPKKSGAAYARYAKYMRACTVGEAVKRGARLDFGYDLKKGFAKCPRLIAKPVLAGAVSVQDRRRHRLALPGLRARAKKRIQRFNRAAKKQRGELLQAIAVKKEQSSVSDAKAKRKKIAWDIPPHAVGGKQVDYQIVVPSYPHRSRIQILRDNTLAFLTRQGVQRRRIHIVVASEAERALYAKSLGKHAPNILVGKRGIVRQREWIVEHFKEGAHILSVDDDVKDVWWKPGRHKKQRALPSGHLDNLVRHADALMRKEGAFLWALNPSGNEMNMRDQISRKSGLANGHFYGYLNRPGCADLRITMGEAAEDCERSVRVFNKDHVLLRYMMYSADTDSFRHSGGLLTQFKSTLARKEAENAHVEKLQEAFPAQVKFEPKESLQTVNIKFPPIGLPPVRHDGASGWACVKIEKESE